MRQNTNMRRAAALSTTTDSYVAFNHLMGANAEAARVFQVGLEDFASLTETEQRQFLNLVRARMIGCEHAYMHHQLGLLTEELWARNLQNAVSLIRHPHMAAWWKARKDTFTADFVRAVDEAPDFPPTALSRSVIQQMMAASKPSS
jgi:hypothetical protein